MLQDYIFNDIDFEGESVSDLPNNPSEAGFSAEDLKARFDNIPKLIMALGKINGFLRYLATSPAAADIGATLKDGTETNLQSAINVITEMIEDIAGQGHSTETIKGAYDKVHKLIDDLSIESGALMVGMPKLYPDDMSGQTVHDKLMVLVDLILTIDKFTPRGIVDNESELPPSGNAYGDFFYIRTADPSTFHEHVWVVPGKWELYGNVSLYALSNKADKDLGNVSNETMYDKVLQSGILADNFNFDNWFSIPGATYSESKNSTTGVWTTIIMLGNRKLAERIDNPKNEQGEFMVTTNVYREDGSILKTATAIEYKNADGVWIREVS